MVVSCAAFNCTQRYEKGTDITFHSFPKDPELRNKWIIAIKRQDFSPSNASRLCSRHFAKDCFIMGHQCLDPNIRRITKLKTEAVPTIFYDNSVGEVVKHWKKQKRQSLTEKEACHDYDSQLCSVEDNMNIKEEPVWAPGYRSQECTLSGAKPLPIEHIKVEPELIVTTLNMELQDEEPSPTPEVDLDIKTEPELNFSSSHRIEQQVQHIKTEPEVVISTGPDIDRLIQVIICFAYTSSTEQRNVKSEITVEHRIDVGNSSMDESRSSGENKKAFVCDTCGRVFMKRELLIRHFRIHTAVRTHPCDKCGKCFSLRTNLRAHLKTHMGLKPHVCPHCGRGFSGRGNLVAHVRTHTGEKPHACAECSKRFALRHHLVKHQLMHSGERGHTCYTCGKSFSLRAKLLVHERMHTGDRPHQCPLCGKCFTWRSNLVNHINTHTSDKKFACNECAKTFMRRGTLTTHFKTHKHKRRVTIMRGSCEAETVVAHD